MNYAHEFHAGNFADVLKHVFLVRILLYLKRKDAAFRYLETHAGSGLYDLSGPEAEKTGEWRDGALRLLGAAVEPQAKALLEPYLSLVEPFLSGDPPRYPGSPLIAALMLRPQDRAIACELHPAAFERLRRALAGRRAVKPTPLDGYLGLKAAIPPPERRGLVLIDPPFEVSGEFVRLERALIVAARKWPSGVFMGWLPVKDQAEVGAFFRRLAEPLVRAGARDALRLDLQIGHVARDGALARAGLVIVNPPFTLEGEARLILPALRQALGGDGAGYLVEKLIAAR